MRISDWSSDVCSSDLSTTRSAMQPAIGGLTPTSISRDRTLLSGVEQPARPMPSISTGARATAVGFIGGNTLSSASWTSKAERQAHERHSLRPEHAARTIHRSEEHTSKLKSLMRRLY